MSLITEWLRKNGYSPPADEVYADIEKWHQWYLADVKSFYSYTVFNGKKTINCKRKTLGMARQSCQDWADLLLNEKVKISCNQQAATDFVVDVMDKNSFWVRGNRCIESAFWAGLAAIVPYPTGVMVNTETGVVVSSDGIGFTYSVGEQIIPLTVLNGECTECAFASEFSESNQRFVRLQIFTKGDDGYYTCQTKLFSISTGALSETDLSALKSTKDMAMLWETGINVTPWAFIRPNISNPRHPDSPFGPAVFAGAIDIIQGIDTVYDAYVNEYALGKTRIVTAVEATKIDIEGNPFFDENDVVFYAVPQGPSSEHYINPIQPQIRAAEMQTGLNDNLSLFAMRCGLGERHYQFNGGSVTTATQVISENSHMFRTLKKHEIVLDASLKHLCRLVLLYGSLYLGKPFDPEQDVTIDFDDSIIEDKQTQNNDMRADVAAGILRPEIYLARKYGVSEAEARKMMPEVDQEAEAYA